MGSIVLDENMVSSLVNGGRIFRQSKRPIELGSPLAVKETYNFRNGILYFKQYCDANNIENKGWKYAATLPEELARFDVGVVYCEKMTFMEFRKEFGRCIVYNRGNWVYDGMLFKKEKWFRERIWQDEEQSLSADYIYAVQYKLVEEHDPEIMFHL